MPRSFQPGGRDGVLIVDHDPERAAFTCVVLERAGYEVCVAVDPAQVARLVSRWRPAVVVTSSPRPSNGLADIPVVVIGRGRLGRGPDSAASITVRAPLDRADLLAAVWVATNP